jgi:CRP/FNR family transcriptional regulator, polysaccharide utilization system transcription regulator
MKLKHRECSECTHKCSSLLNYCSDEQLQFISDRKSTCFYKKGQAIFHEGGIPSGLYFIYEGKIKVVKVMSDGKEQIIRLGKPSDTLGYRALLAGSRYSASAVAIEDSTVCYIPKDYFNKVVSDNPKIGNELIRMLSVSLGEAEQRMTQIALKPVRERLAEGLLFLYTTYGAGEKEFSISISREDLANLIGTSKETATRFLTEFKDDKILTTHGSNIKILNKEKLIKISELYD